MLGWVLKDSRSLVDSQVQTVQFTFSTPNVGPEFLISKTIQTLFNFYSLLELVQKVGQ